VCVGSAVGLRRPRLGLSCKEGAADAQDRWGQAGVDGVGPMTLLRPTHIREVHSFGRLRDGPEAELQGIIAKALPDLIDSSGSRVWAGSSLPIGAGLPDLLAATYRPQVEMIAALSSQHLAIIAYLRSVSKAKLDTIADRVAAPVSRVSTCVECLLEIQVIRRIGNSFRLYDEWRDVLPEVVAIEVKVSDWRRGVQQAARNLLFANKSFLALPLRVAKRVKQDEFAGAVGLGLIGIDDLGALHVVRRPRKSSPKVWSYYYGVAQAVAASTRGT